MVSPKVQANSIFTASKIKNGNTHTVKADQRSVFIKIRYHMVPKA